MSKAHPDPLNAQLHESRLARAMDEYLQALEAGCADRDAILKRHSEIAEELAECLESVEFIHSVSPELSISASKHSDQIGTTSQFPTAVKSVGDFCILHELGRGGMGVVYEAEQQSLGRGVALKILPFAALLNETQLERFATEATAAARLQHESIVTVYSVGCERGIHFIAMQLIEGPSLADVIAELRQERHLGDNEQLVSPDTVVAKKANVLTRDADGGHYRAVARIGRQAAEALHYAHEHGVLHRDIKPSNLLLDASGHVWIADFGLARIEDESQLTRTGDILGTLHYMSPEQATGQRDKIGAQSDVYGLGATLYELATLTPVFDNADRREVIKQVVAGNPVAPHKVDPSVPRPLSLVISKSMARRLDERYQSAQELADDLQRFLDGEPVKAKPATPLRRARAWSRRHRLASATIVSLLILVLLLPFSHHFFQRVPDDSPTKGHDMKVSKTAKVAVAVAAMAIVTAGVNAKKPPKPPRVPNPTDLVVSAVTADAITLDWISGGGSTAGFMVAYKEGTRYPKSNLRGATVIEVADVEGYTVTDLLTDQIYSFRVCAVDSNGKRSSGVTVQGITVSDAELIVSPSAYADTEGTAGGNAANPIGRYQQVFPASDFHSLPEGVTTITQFANRPDGTMTTPFDGMYGTLTVKLSTTSADPGSLSMTYADNTGADEVLVLSGTDFAMSSRNRGPAGGPKEFDMIYTLQTPFEYDPDQGNLLMDVSFTYEGGFSADLVNDAGTGQQLIGSNDFAGPTAIFSMGGFVTQFTVVPDP